MFGTPTAATRERDEAMGRIKRLADDPRTRHLEDLEATWKGLRYEREGRASFFDKSVPLQDRAPCIVDPIVRVAGRRLASLVFGESRFPTLSVRAG